MFSSFLPRIEELTEYVSLLHWVLRLGLLPGLCTTWKQVKSEDTARCSSLLQPSWQEHCSPMLGATESSRRCNEAHEAEHKRYRTTRSGPLTSQLQRARCKAPARVERPETLQCPGYLVEGDADVSRAVAERTHERTLPSCSSGRKSGEVDDAFLPGNLIRR